MTVEDVQGLVKTTLGEVEHILSTKTVVGEPMTVEGNTIIPIVSIGFAFAGGGLAGKGTKERGEGGASGIAGGGGVRPVAVVIIDKEGSIKVEPTHGTIVPVVERVVDLANKAIEKRFGKKEKEEKEEEEGK